MEKVEKYISEAMSWLNSKMNAQNKLSLTQDPVVKVSEIVTKSKVRNHKIFLLIGSSTKNFSGSHTLRNNQLAKELSKTNLGLFFFF